MQIENSGTDEQVFQDNLIKYYQHIFPFQLLFDWLRYECDNPPQLGINTYIERREFSFESKIEDIEIYSRYQNFSNPQQMQAQLTNKSQIVQKYDIGAVFNKRPKKAQDQEAIEKEFVIDIDMTDYNDVRNCCTGAAICKRCWKFIEVACKVLYAALTEDFGFQHILWIYSGRRGIHLWICDKKARQMPNNLRKAIVSYLNINISNETSEQLVKKMDRQTYHPSINNALKIINKYFEEIIIQDQKSLTNEKVLQKINNLLKSIHIEIPINQIDRQRFLKKYFTENNNQSRFKDILQDSQYDSSHLYQYLQDVLRDENKQYYQKYLDQIKIMTIYPRLDANVSTTINHLLKGPFSIHPKTLRVCVPFTYKNFKNFDFEKVPKLDQLIEELSQINSTQLQLQDNFYPSIAKETSLKEYIEIFENFIKEYRGKNERLNDEQF